MDFHEMMNRVMGIKTISIEKIIENKDKRPKRICFNSTHVHACRRIEIKGNTVVGTINIPFDDSIKPFIETETDSKVVLKFDGKYWCPANSDEEFEKLELFVEKYKNTVFIRDTLEISIAISEHMLNEDNRTEIGDLEYEAKYSECEISIKKLEDIIVSFINNTSVYDEATLICSVPSSVKEKLNLPQKLCKNISERINKIDISSNIEWKNSKPKIKELDLDEKLDALQQTDLLVNFDVKNKNIILVDDLYQSGLTMQFVAMKLKENGARKIFGISIVKSRRDTDNND